MGSLRHHVLIESSRFGLMVELLVSLNDFTLGTSEPIAVENLSTAYTYMPRHDLLPLALAESGNFPPRDLPPACSLHSSQLPVGSINDSQSELRVAYPPEMLRRRFLCCWHFILLIMIALAHGHPVCDHARSSFPGAFAAVSGRCGTPDWLVSAAPEKCGSYGAGAWILN